MDLKVDVETFEAMRSLVHQRGLNSRLELTIHGNGYSVAKREQINDVLVVKEVNANQEPLFDKLKSKVYYELE